MSATLRVRHEVHVGSEHREVVWSLPTDRTTLQLVDELRPAGFVNNVDGDELLAEVTVDLGEMSDDAAMTVYAEMRRRFT